MTIMEKLGLNKMLKNKEYQVIIIRENENELIGFVKLKGQGEITFDYLNDKLYVNGEEKNLNWFEDFLFVYNCCKNDKINLAKNGKYLDILVNDKNYDIRIEVARQGYGLDILVNDPNWVVRNTVAQQKYGLDVLVNDKHCYVRIAVAEQGYGLESLINDKDWEVRNAVVQQGYGLDVLINDKHWYVRRSVAVEGYGLNKLINDSNEYVVGYANKWLKDNTLTLDEWVKQYPERCVLVE